MRLQTNNWEERLLAAAADTAFVYKLLKLRLLDNIHMPTGQTIKIQQETARIRSINFQRAIAESIELARQIAKSIATEQENPEGIAEWLSDNIGRVVGRLMQSQGYQGWGYYVNRLARFSIYYPPGWRVQEAHLGREPAKHHVLFSDESRHWSFNIMVNPVIPGRADPESFRETWEFSVAFRRGRVESSQTTYIAGIPAFEGISLTRRWFRFGRFSTKVKKIALAVGDQEFIITASAPIRDFKAFDALLNRSIETLTFAD